jgi:hypothetical protein
MDFDNRDEFIKAVNYADRVNQALELLHVHFPTTGPDQVYFEPNLDPDAPAVRWGATINNWGAEPAHAKAGGRIIIRLNEQNLPGINDFSADVLDLMQTKLLKAFAQIFGKNTGAAIEFGRITADEQQLMVFMKTDYLDEQVLHMLDVLPSLIDNAIDSGNLHFTRNIAFPHYRLTGTDELVCITTDIEEQLARYTAATHADGGIAGEAGNPWLNSGIDFESLG